METDKEHFIVEDINRWTDKVLAGIDGDLSAQPWSDVRPLTESFARLATAETPVSAPSSTPATASLIVKAKLVSKTEPIRREQLLPYQEFLVGFVYDVEQVIAGNYQEKQIIVMQPAYIGLH